MGKEMRMNVFIEPILNKKKKFHLSSYIQLRLLIKKLRKSSPDFNTMLEIYDFLILLNKLYMYCNYGNHNLFSCTTGKQFDAAFVYEQDNFSIKFGLVKESRQINILIERRFVGQREKEQISFYEGEDIIKDKYDEEKFLFIISCLTNGVIDLLKYFYKNKKF